MEGRINMLEKVYITGHKNPDTDSICAAITYAYLKNKSGDVEAIPIRIGELNDETKWVLNKWGFEAPEYVSSLKSQIKDLKLDKPFTVSKELSINKAARFIQEKDVQALPVVNDREVLEGIVTLSNLTKSYMEVWDDKILWRSRTSIENMIDVLSADIINLPDDVRPYDGRILVYASVVDEKGHTQKGDIVICGNREDVHREAIRNGAAVIILSSGAVATDEILKEAKDKSVLILSTTYNSYMVARLLPQAVPISYVMSTENLMTFHPEDFLEDVEKQIRDTRFRNFPVVNHANQVVGYLSRNNLLFDEKKNLILVDHNERNQSIDDFDSVEIKEIIDHHRVANIMTNKPIYFRNIPVGSTCSIISMMYFEEGVTPPKEIACLLASAIISDTLLFRSPTTTPVDKQILMRLARIANLDVEAYAMEMFKAGTSLGNKKPADILLQDSKMFNIDDNQVRVSQTFTTDLDSLGAIEGKVIDKMAEIKAANASDSFALLMTDIFAEKSKVLVVGKFGEAIAKEFGVSYDPKGFIVEGLLSRKKQFIPTITAAISKSIE